MLESLKRLAMQKLVERMAGNSLNPEATNAAATEGASSLVDNIQNMLGEGNLDQVKGLLSGATGNLESNGLFQNLQGKLGEILQSKGMNAEEATQEAKSTMPDIINGLRSKFESQDAADSEFDISNLTGLIGGSAGDVLKKLF